MQYLAKACSPESHASTILVGFLISLWDAVLLDLVGWGSGAFSLRLSSCAEVETLNPEPSATVP